MNEQLCGKEITLYGWVQIKREHGGVIFVDLRDRSGIVQLVFDENHNEQLFKQTIQLKSEYVIQISGVVRRRENPNPQLLTGLFEILVNTVTVLNSSKTPPIQVIKQGTIAEEFRLKYRYIDLRRTHMQNNILMRHRIAISIRNYLNNKEFIDIETPFLTKSTPEGARDFIVPSRLNQGKFYALPQSPQIFKQLLMISGFEKYYQIVRCFRDEDLRADRQPEFTQLDIEASFIQEEDIYTLINGLFATVLQECYDESIESPIKRIRYDEALEKYGTDRPDLRYELSLRNLTDFAQQGKPKEFIDEGIQSGKLLYGIIFPYSDKISRKVLDGFSTQAKETGNGIFSWAKVNNNEVSGPFVKLFTEDIRNRITLLSKEKSFFVVVSFGNKKQVLQFLGAIRVQIADILKLIETEKRAFCWITDFPLFEWSDDENKIVSVHHPFTAPKGEIDINDIYKTKSRSYDFVLNGVELGGGSIRIHNSETQRNIFKILNLSEENIERKFGFLVDALDYGAPPHGGIAFGLDRIVMMLQRERSIREVIPFPKTTSGMCPLTGAPDFISNNQLTELGLCLK